MQNFLMISDIHFRDSPPKVWDGNEKDWNETVEGTFQKIYETMDRYDCGLCLCGGDIFDKWNSNPRTIGRAIEYLPKNMITVPGQHDLPNHSLSYYDSSALATLEKARKDIVVLKKNQYIEDKEFLIKGFPWNTQWKGVDEDDERLKIALGHLLVWKDERPWPEVPMANLAEYIIEKNHSFDLIITGDNHQSFKTNLGATDLVNPGSLFQLTAKQIDFHPKMYLYKPEGRKILHKRLEKAKEGVLSRVYLDAKEEQDKRIEKFITTISSKYKIDIDFQKSMESFLYENDKISEEVKNIIWECISDE